MYTQNIFCHRQIAYDSAYKFFWLDSVDAGTVFRSQMALHESLGLPTVIERKSIRANRRLSFIANRNTIPNVKGLGLYFIYFQFFFFLGGWLLRINDFHFVNCNHIICRGAGQIFCWLSLS